MKHILIYLDHIFLGILWEFSFSFVITRFLFSEYTKNWTMAMHVPRAPGFSSMMKDGARFFSGLEEAVIRFVVHNDAGLPIKDET